jgi:biotin-[acetyl-CoA-carboxylase] ligase BirA-like protein
MGQNSLPPLPKPEFKEEAFETELRAARAYLEAQNSFKGKRTVPERKGRLQKVLVDNRGEIAKRFFIELKRLGIPSVAVVTDADRGASWYRFADEVVFIGDSKNHKNIPVICAAMQATGANAVYPGYGFLSENPEFVEAVAALGKMTGKEFIFMGPTAGTMRAVGLKDKARELAKKHNVNLFPGSGLIRDLAHAKEEARRIGYPLLLKLTAGGGGKGMTIVENESELESGINATKSVGLDLYDDDRFYMERYLTKPSHYEEQTFNGWPLGTRKCAVQREHQKVIEETAWLSEDLLQILFQNSNSITTAAGYENGGAGTVEFLIDEGVSADADPRSKIGFLEVNTRLQVEHTVTEESVGINLATLQILHFDGQAELVEEHLQRARENLFKPRQHTIELRILAEDASRNFDSSTGLITEMSLPTFKGVRCDFGFAAGDFVPDSFDSMIGKLIVTGDTREEAIARARTALEELSIKGITTNIDFLRRILDHPEFVSNEYDNNFLKNHPELLKSADDPASEELAAVSAAIARYVASREEVAKNLFAPGSGGLTNQETRQQLENLPHTFRLRIQGRDYEIRLAEKLGVLGATVNGRFRFEVKVSELARGRFDLEIGTQHFRCDVDERRLRTVIRVPDRNRVMRHHEVQFLTEKELGSTATDVEYPAPYNAKFVSLGDNRQGPTRRRLKIGDHVEKGEVIITISSMKKEKYQEAPVSGTLTSLVNDGDESKLIMGYNDKGQVIGAPLEEGQLLFKIRPDHVSETPQTTFDPQAIPRNQNRDLVSESSVFRLGLESRHHTVVPRFIDSLGESLPESLDFLRSRMLGLEIQAPHRQAILELIAAGEGAQKDLFLKKLASIPPGKMIPLLIQILETFSDLDLIFSRVSPAEDQISYYGWLRALVDRWNDFSFEPPPEVRDVLLRLLSGIGDLDRRAENKRRRLEQSVIALIRSGDRLKESEETLERLLDLLAVYWRQRAPLEKEGNAEEALLWEGLSKSLQRLIRQKKSSNAISLLGKGKKVLEAIDPRAAFWLDLPPVAEKYKGSFEQFYQDPYHDLGKEGSPERAKKISLMQRSLVKARSIGRFLKDHEEQLTKTAREEIARLGGEYQAESLYSPYENVHIFRLTDPKNPEISRYVVMAVNREPVALESVGGEVVGCPMVENSVVLASKLLAMYERLAPAATQNRMQIIVDQGRLDVRLTGTGREGELNEKKVREIALKVMSFTHGLKLEKTAILYKNAKGESRVLALSRDGRQLVVRDSRRAASSEPIRLPQLTPEDQKLYSAGKWPVSRWLEEIFGEGAEVQEISIPGVDDQGVRVESRLFVGEVDGKKAVVYYKDPTAPFRGATGDLEGLKKFAFNYLAYVIFQATPVEINDGSGANVSQGMKALKRAGQGFAANTLTSGLSTPEKFLRYLKNIEDPVIRKLIDDLNRLHAPGTSLSGLLRRVKRPSVSVSLQAGSGSGLDVYGSSQTVIQIMIDGVLVFRVLTGEKVNEAATGEKATNQQMGGARMMGELTGTVDAVAWNNGESARLARRAIAFAPSAVSERFIPILRVDNEGNGQPTLGKKMPFEVVNTDILKAHVDRGDFWEMKKPYVGSGAGITGLATLGGQTVSFLASRTDYGIGSENGLTRTWEGLSQARKMGVPQILISGKRWLGYSHDHEPAVIDLKREIMEELGHRDQPRILIVTDREGLRQSEIMAHVDVVIYVSSNGPSSDPLASLATMTAPSFGEAMDLANSLLWLLALNRENKRGRRGEVFDPADRPTLKIKEMAEAGSWDMKEFVGDFVDNGFFIEFEPNSHDPKVGPSLMTGLALLDGRLIGILADTDAADYRGTDKYRRFVEFCNRHHIYTKSIPNAGGFRPGIAQERGRIQQRGAKSLDQNILGEQGADSMTIMAYGGHVIHRFMKILRPGIQAAAYANAEMAVMGREAAFNLFIGFKFAERLGKEEYEEADQDLDKFVKKYHVALTEADLKKTPPELKAKEPREFLTKKFEIIKKRFDEQFTEFARADHDAKASGLIDVVIGDPAITRAAAIETMYRAREAAASAFLNKSDPMTDDEALMVSVVKRLEGMGIVVRPVIPDRDAPPEDHRIEIEGVEGRLRPSDLEPLIEYSLGLKDKVLWDLNAMLKQPPEGRARWLENYACLERLDLAYRDVRRALETGGTATYGTEIDSQAKAALGAILVGCEAFFDYSRGRQRFHEETEGAEGREPDRTISPARGEYRSSVAAEQPLDERIVRKRLKGKKDLVVRYYPSTASTNTLAKRAKADGARWELFAADYQTAGYGQQGRVWDSPRGNLAFTLLWRHHKIKEKDVPKLSLVAGLAVAKTLGRFLPDGVTVKWPNDVYIDGLKVAGILIEDAQDGGLAIGIGINVNSTLNDFPPEGRGQRITLKDKLGRPLSREEVLIKVVEAVLRECNRFRSGDWAGILRDFEKLSFLSGREVEIQEGKDEWIRGIVQGIDETGQLFVKGGVGRTRHLAAGEVTVRGSSKPA